LPQKSGKYPKFLIIKSLIITVFIEFSSIIVNFKVENEVPSITSEKLKIERQWQHARQTSSNSEGR
jgi:hypothetical protein